MTPITCKLSEIRIDGGTQPRTALDDGTVAEYAEAMMIGDTFPPLTVVWDGVSRWLADGFHRFHAMRQVGLLEVECHQHSGTRRDAILIACGSNGSHGLRRTQADKRRAVRMLLEDDEWSNWSDRKIAKLSATSHGLVAAVREEMAAKPAAQPSADTCDLEKLPDSTPRKRTVERGGKVFEQALREPAKAAPAEDSGVTAADLLDEMQRDLTKAEARIADLEAALSSDGKDAVVKLSQRLEHSERRTAELMEEASRAKGRADRYERMLARIGKAVGDRDLDNLAPRVEALARKVREAKVAA